MVYYAKQRIRNKPFTYRNVCLREAVKLLCFSKKDDSNFGRCGASFFVACILATRPKDVKCYFCAFYSVWLFVLSYV